MLKFHSGPLSDSMTLQDAPDHDYKPYPPGPHVDPYQYHDYSEFDEQFGAEPPLSVAETFRRIDQLEVDLMDLERKLFWTGFKIIACALFTVGHGFLLFNATVRLMEQM